MSSIDKLIAMINEKVTEVDAFGKTIKLILDDTIIIIDGTTQPPSISSDDTTADITVTASAENFEKILTKKMNPQMAMMSGKIKLSGDMMAAVPLMKIF